MFLPQQQNVMDYQPSNLQVTQSLQSERGFRMFETSEEDHQYLNLLHSEEEESDQGKQKIKLKKKTG